MAQPQNVRILFFQQGSTLGPLLFNICLNDIFLFISNSRICNNTDDNALFAVNKNLHVLKSILEVAFAILQKRFYAQSAFTWSKLTIETLEQGVKYVQS